MALAVGFMPGLLTRMPPFGEEHLNVVAEGGCRRARILHDAPEDAASHVREAWADPSAWWNSGDVQQAREQFVCRFALAQNEWLDEWARTIEDVVWSSCSQGRGRR